MATDPSPLSAMLAEELTSAKEKARLDQEMVEEGKRASHVRPWDKGKSESFRLLGEDHSMANYGKPKQTC